MSAIDYIDNKDCKKRYKNALPISIIGNFFI